MLFRRRRPETVFEKVRAVFWPRKSFQRSLLYLKKRILRLHATPHAIAAGFAAGVFASFTPFIGFHFLIAFAIAYGIGGNMGSAALGTVLGNPFTFPLIWAGTYEIGTFILHDPTDLGHPHAVGFALRELDFLAIWEPLLKPMLVGCVPIGLVLAAVAYGLVHAGVRRFQTRRAARLAERALAAARSALTP